MNKRQKKKLYKKLHGYNQQKIADAQRNVQPKVPAPKQQLNHEALLKYQRPWDKVRPLEDSDFAQRISDPVQKQVTEVQQLQNQQQTPETLLEPEKPYIQ